MSVLSLPIGEKATIHLLTLTLTIIKSIKLQNQHPPDHVPSTSSSNTQAKLLYVKCTVLVSISTYEIKNKKSCIGHQLLIIFITNERTVGSCGLPDDILSQEFGLSVPVGGAGGGAGRIRRGFTVEHVVSAVREDVKSRTTTFYRFTEGKVSGGC